MIQALKEDVSGHLLTTGLEHSGRANRPPNVSIRSYYCHLPPPRRRYREGISEVELLVSLRCQAGGWEANPWEEAQLCYSLRHNELALSRELHLSLPCDIPSRPFIRRASRIFRLAKR